MGEPFGNSGSEEPRPRDLSAEVRELRRINKGLMAYAQRLRTRCSASPYETPTERYLAKGVMDLERLANE